MDAFISHSSKNHARAQRLEAALEARGLGVWLDDSEIRLGVLLSEELQTSIRESGTLVLLWSRAASASRWVNSEWLMALHQDVFVLPCTLDETPLPQCLQNSVYLDLRRINDRDVDKLARAIGEPHAGANRLAPAMRGESPELRAAIEALAEGQLAVTDSLGRRDLGEAAEGQSRLDELTKECGNSRTADPAYLGQFVSTVRVRVAVLPSVSVTVTVSVCGRLSGRGKPRLWPSHVSHSLRLPRLLHCQGAWLCSSSELLSSPSTMKRAFLTR